MTKYLFVLMFSMANLWGLDIPIDKVEKRVFKDVIEVNSQVVQRSDAKESVMARMGGKVKKYFVQEGQTVKKGQKIAKIESLELSSLSSRLKLLRQQLRVHNKNYKILKNLYDLGLETAQNLNREQRERDETASQIESVKRQLSLLGVSSSTGLKSTYTLYAGSDGRVSKVLAPINSVVNSDTPLLSIIKGYKSILLKSFIPLRHASSINVNQKGEMFYEGKYYKIHISQILPEIDEETQQVVVLSTLDEKVEKLFINAFVATRFHVGEAKYYLSVKKSALNFFNNEWVVFVPKENKDEHDAHAGHDHAKHDSVDDHAGHDHAKHDSVDDHAGHDHAKHDSLDDHTGHDHAKHDSLDDHAGHDHAKHEEEVVPFDIKVIKIIKQNQNYVAMEGLEEHEQYVSDKAYHIKSLLLKSSLGGHGH